MGLGHCAVVCQFQGLFDFEAPKNTKEAFNRLCTPSLVNVHICRDSFTAWTVEDHDLLVELSQTGTFMADKQTFGRPWLGGAYLNSYRGHLRLRPHGRASQRNRLDRMVLRVDVTRGSFAPSLL